jgi:F420-0:gamma-glutamyl ligase
MLVTPVKTYTIRYYEQPSLEEVLADCLPLLAEKTVVAITSKIVSLCEGSYVYREGYEKQELIEQQADLYMHAVMSRDGTRSSHALTVTNGVLIPAAGIDRSKNLFILWPSDPQYTANRIRKFLAQHYGLKEVGVVITDSTTRLLRRGVAGIPLAHSGFRALTGGRRYKRDVAMGLAASAVLCMGEGGASTPLAVISDVPFVKFVSHDPRATELADIKTNFETDLFHPLLTHAKWRKGRAHSSTNSGN